MYEDQKKKTKATLQSLPPENAPAERPMLEKQQVTVRIKLTC
jgi:hypothetical protein